MHMLYLKLIHDKWTGYTAHDHRDIVPDGIVENAKAWSRFGSLNQWTVTTTITDCLHTSLPLQLLVLWLTWCYISKAVQHDGVDKLNLGIRLTKHNLNNDCSTIFIQLSPTSLRGIISVSETFHLGFHLSSLLTVTVALRTAHLIFFLRLCFSRLSNTFRQVNVSFLFFWHLRRQRWPVLTNLGANRSMHR